MPNDFFTCKNFESLLPKKYTPVPPEKLKVAIGYYRRRLERTGYVGREDTCRSVDTVVRYFATLLEHRKSSMASSEEKKSAKQQFREPNAEKTTVYAPPSKGLFMFGGCGTGKTMLLDRLCAQEKKPFKDNPEQHYLIDGVLITNAKDITTAYQIDGEKWFCDCIMENRKREMVIDDIGSERKTLRFGSAAIIPDVIFDRYESFINYGTTSIFTSNVGSLAEIDELYGTRIASRIAEMCNVVPFIGDDWRLKQ